MLSSPALQFGHTKHFSARSARSSGGIWQVRGITLIALTTCAFALAIGRTSPALAQEPEPMYALELQMLDLVNRDRAAEGLPPLQWNSRAAAIARTHSRDMALNEFFAHASPATGLARDRFFAARFMTAALAENLARSATIREAQDKLLQSPSHRQNIMNPVFTEVGIGIVRTAKGELFITQNFLVPIIYSDVTRDISRWLRQANEARRTEGLRDLQWDNALATLAQRHSRTLADKSELFDVPTAWLTGVRAYRTIANAVLFAASIDELSELEMVGDSRFTAIGVGAVRNLTQPKAFGMLWVTIIMGQK